VLEGVSNTYSIPLTVGPNMATVPVESGFVCDKVTVLRKMIKHIYFFYQNMDNRLLEQRMNINFLLTLEKQL
jgi:hypothetical protein